MTEHEKLVEQVARAICSSSGLSPDECVHGSGGMSNGTHYHFECRTRRWQLYRYQATAAIAAVHAALQEPIWMNDGDYVGHTPRQAWRTMIDASPLKEK